MIRQTLIMVRMAGSRTTHLTCCQHMNNNHINDEGILRFSAFNIQVFGTTKASKPDVMDVLGKIIRNYDVVAIQEIRDKSQTALPALVDTVNSDG